MMFVFLPLFLLASTSAQAAVCLGAFFTESSIGAGGSTAVRFSRGRAATIGDYRFSIQGTTHGEAEIVSVFSVSQSRWVFTSRHEIAPLRAPKSLEVSLVVPEGAITISCQ